MEKKYLSICIPTNGRVDIVKNTLDSIFEGCIVDFNDFEVILSDNSTNNELLVLLESYKQFSNIIYVKTDSQGFLNSLNALKTANGILLKLHNNYTMFTKDGLFKLIEFVKREQLDKPFPFFTNFGKDGIKRYTSFDTFNSELTFWSSWSTGFSIWKEDFDKINNLDVNKMFPHTSLFLSQYLKSSFVKNDEVYFLNQEVPNKGGYNLFRTFAVDYISIIKDSKSNGHISEATLKKIKKDLFYRFLIIWYCNTKLVKNSYTFSLDGIRKSLSINYGALGYYKLIFWSYVYFFKIKIKF